MTAYVDQAYLKFLDIYFVSASQTLELKLCAFTTVMTFCFSFF